MTPLAHAQNFTFGYELSPSNLFNSISFRIHSQSRIGLIGDNGCGKSTLFQLLQQAALGQIRGISCISPLRIVLHEQDALKHHVDKTIEEFLWHGHPNLWQAKCRLDQLSAGSVWRDSDSAMLEQFDADDGYHFLNQIERYHHEFKLSYLPLTRTISELSGGERQKFGLIRLLLEKPDLLLLDEPTNHLDQDGLSWLSEFLNTIEIPFVVISHERQFLDQVVNEVWHLKNQNLTTYPGTYSDYKAHQEAEYQKQLHLYEVQKEKIQKLETALEAQQSRAQELNRFRPERGRAKNGRILSRDTYKVKTCEIDSNMMSKAKAMETRITQMITKEHAAKPDLERKKKIAIETSTVRSRHLLQLQGISFQRENRWILRDVDLSLRPGEQLILSGANGSGKTTLLEIITEKIAPTRGSIGKSPQLMCAYLTQSPTLAGNKGKNLLELLSEFSKQRQQSIRNLLGSFYFPQDGFLRDLEKLSPGEVQKASLALMLTSDCNLLILDEPTNHLEISSREALQNALLNFEGSFILTSHDGHLKKALMTKACELIL